MSSLRVRCAAEERRRGVVSAIVNEGGGQDRPSSDLTRVLEFFPDRSSLPDGVLEDIRDGIRLRCWCRRFGPVSDELTVGKLQKRVYRQHRRQGGPVRQEGSPEECCT